MINLPAGEIGNLAYLDNAASTPMRPEVRSTMADIQDTYCNIGLNPSSLHSAGRIARELLEDARQRIADALGADAAEIVFTSGGTESDALFVSGIGGTIAVSAIEHPAISANCIARRTVAVDADGLLNFDDLAAAVRDDTVKAVSVMAVSNETGVIQDIAKVVEVSRLERPDMLVHSDAVQAIGRVPMKFHSLGLDALSISAHKFGGPVGIGALCIKRGIALASDRRGGGQERSLRSGTQAVILAQGFARAVELAIAQRNDQWRRHEQLRARLIAGIVHIPDVKTTVDPALCVPSITHFTVTGGASAEVLLMLLDRAGICASAGSACHAGVARPSETLVAMGRGEREAMGALRVSFGWNTKESDVDKLVAALPDAVYAAQSMGERR